MTAPGILGRILAHKAEEVALARRLGSEAALREAAAAAGPARGFAAALARGPAPRVVAEVKRASPSRGPFVVAGWDPTAVARRHAAAGATCLSVLTDGRFFWGSLADLAAARSAVALPALRKDFVIDPWQLWEARAAGADAALLIVAALGDGPLAELLGVASEVGLDALVEVHDADEARRAVDAGARLVGVNNRDLTRFTVDLSVTERLAPALVDAGCTVVAESGLFTGADAARVVAAGARGLLVGEALMKAEDPRAVVAGLTGGAR